MDYDLDAGAYFRSYDYFLSQGYSEDRAHLTSMARTSLMQGTEQLVRYRQRPPGGRNAREGERVEVITGSFTGGNYNTEGILLHDNVLLPEWTQFASALSSATANGRGYIILSLFDVQLSQVVAEILLQSLERAPLRALWFINNNLGSDGIEFVAGALEKNPGIEGMGVASNHIRSSRDADTLVRAASDHPTLRVLHLDKCRIGQSNDVISAIVPCLYHLKVISLLGNYIGSHGAILISNCLASNPCTRVLNLSANLFNDGDAKVLAKSLKTNTNLHQLYLCENPITKVGAEALTQAVSSRSSLNELYYSNHTCSISVSEDNGHFLSEANGSADPGLNRKRKLLSALITYNSGSTKVCLDDAPKKIMPKVLVFLQDEEFFTAAGQVEALFLFIRKWKMQLLGTSYIGPTMRRSKRIRKRKFMDLMEICGATNGC